EAKHIDIQRVSHARQNVLQNVVHIVAPDVEQMYVFAGVSGVRLFLRILRKIGQSKSLQALRRVTYSITGALYCRRGVDRQRVCHRGILSRVLGTSSQRNVSLGRTDRLGYVQFRIRQLRGGCDRGGAMGYCIRRSGGVRFGGAIGFFLSHVTFPFCWQQDRCEDTTLEGARRSTYYLEGTIF